MTWYLTSLRRLRRLKILNNTGVLKIRDSSLSWDRLETVACKPAVLRAVFGFCENVHVNLKNEKIREIIRLRELSKENEAISDNI